MALKRVCDRNVKACQTCTNEVSKLELQEQLDIFYAPTGVESPVCSSVWYSLCLHTVLRAFIILHLIHTVNNVGRTVNLQHVYTL